MDIDMEAGKACNFCQRITKYTCLRCQKIACAICAPETPDTEKESDYNPQHHVGISKECQTKTKDLGDKVLDKEESPISPTANKRKQWTREQKLEFIALYKKYKSKSRAAKELQVKYKHTLNSRTYNRWITNESKIRSAGYGSKKIGFGRKAFYPVWKKDCMTSLQQ